MVLICLFDYLWSWYAKLCYTIYDCLLVQALVGAPKLNRRSQVTAPQSEALKLSRAVAGKDQATPENCCPIKKLCNSKNPGHLQTLNQLVGFRTVAPTDSSHSTSWKLSAPTHVEQTHVCGHHGVHEVSEIHEESWAKLISHHPAKETIKGWSWLVFTGLPPIRWLLLLGLLDGSKTWDCF